MSQVIPAEAVEAAWEQARADSDGYPYPEREEIRRILEAAAPYMLAVAWEEGRLVGRAEEQSGFDTEMNPYGATK